MSDLIKVAEDVKGLAKKFRGILELADALEEIGKLEQAAKEAQNLKQIAHDELNKIKESIEASKKDLEAAELSVSYANAKADKIVEAAHAKGSDIINQAVLKSNDVAWGIEKNKRSMDEKFISAGKELASIETDVVLKKQELEAVKKELEAVKQRFASLLK